jgi:hypothetical protein
LAALDKLGRLAVVRSPLRAANASGLSTISIARGVGHNPHSIPAVRGIDTASWNNKRPDFEPLGFQISAHRLENQSVRPINKAANVLRDDPTGPSIANDPEHFGP